MSDLVNGNGAAVSSEGNGLHAAKKNPPSVMSNQLREELIRILRTGDERNEGAFTVAVATHVEKFAVAAREILMTEDLAQKDLASLLMMRRQHPMSGMWNPIVGVGDSVGGGYLPPIVNNENYGTQAVRQIVDAAKTIGDSPAKLVEALVIAREKNLPDVAAALEKKLGVAKEEVTPAGNAPNGTGKELL